MTIADHLYGYGQAAAPRQAATATLVDAVQAITALDQQLLGHPLAPAWARAERAIAVAAAAAEAGPGSADLQLILRARLSGICLPAGHVALLDLDARARAWELVRQRKGSAALRALVAQLGRGRGTRDLAGLADAIAAALAASATASWEVTRAGQRTATLTVAPGSASDRGDIALAVPYALRRLGCTRTLLPALSGRVQTLSVETLSVQTLSIQTLSVLPVDDAGFGERGVASEDGPHAAALAPLTRWATTLAGQARAGTARLNRLERYVAQVEQQLSLVRRPAALRRLVGVGLSCWGLWAAQLARITSVELSSAWRTLAQAAELGLVAAVPGDGARSRGDATVYAIPPWLHLAGLVPAPRGRPTAAPPGAAGQGSVAATAAAMAEAAAAIAELDALLARSVSATVSTTVPATMPEAVPQARR